MSRRKRRERDSLYQKRQRDVNIIEILVSIIELKDPATARHCRSVAKYALAIGKELGLPGDKLDKLNQAAVLHDIGKILVDCRVLNNGEKLSDREFMEIKNHAAMGMRILSLFSFPSCVIDVAWHHHEKWDGTGYPDGLSGESIHFLTRIVSVADALDAMTEDRPYREHLTDNKIVEQLETERGKQFDPEIANAAIRLIREKRIR